MVSKRTLTQEDAGSALALVLLFIVFICVWLGSVTLLTQSSSSAIKKNLLQSDLRSQYVGYGFDAALSALTPYPGNSCPSAGGIDDQVNPCRRGTLPNKCSTEDFNAAFITARSAITPTNINNTLNLTDLTVTCDQAPMSGLISSLPSLILTGDGLGCLSDCVTGKDGGLQITASGASDPEPFCSSINGASSRYVVSGSVFNRSGMWLGVDCTDFEIKKLPLETSYIYQPTSSLDFCPTDFVNTTCRPLNVWGGKADGIGIVKNLSYNNINTKVNAFISYTANKLDPFPESRARLNPNVTSCSSDLASIQIYPGLISDDPINDGDGDDVLTLTKLNQLTSSNGCGNGVTGTAIVFNGGVYGFKGSTSTSSDTTNTWSINFPGSTTGSVFAGLPNWSGQGASATPCGSSPVSHGARFLFKGYSYLDLRRGKFIACASSKSDPRGAGYDPILVQPVISAPIELWGIPSQGSSASNGAVITTAQGNSSGNSDDCSSADVCLKIMGSIFTPASYLDISLNGMTYSYVRNGIISKALLIRATSSGPPTKSVGSPGLLTNGDRLVQLNFWIKKGLPLQQWLGSVQLRIYDALGENIASGYIRRAWRVGW
jgi:hypothetical protein